MPRIAPDVFWKCAGTTTANRVAVGVALPDQHCGSPIPEEMKDESLNGDWLHSTPDLLQAMKDAGVTPVMLSADLDKCQDVEMMKRRVDFTKKLGLNRLAFSLNPELTEEDMLPASQNLKEAAKYAASCGVAMDVETYSGITVNGATCARLVELVGESNFFLNYDPGNVLAFNPQLVAPEEFLKDFKIALPFMNNFHLKDFDPATRDNVPLGTGCVPWKEAFKLLADANYTGMVGLDLDDSAAMRIGTPEAHLDAINKSLSYLESIL